MAKKAKKPAPNARRQQASKKLDDPTVAKKKTKKVDRPSPNRTRTGWREPPVRKTTPSGHGYVLYITGKDSGRIVYDPIDMIAVDPPEPIKRNESVKRDEPVNRKKPVKRAKKRRKDD